MSKHFTVYVCMFTCPCILATALTRFLLVCLPTKQILTRKRLWGISIVISVVPIASVSSYGFYYLSKHDYACWQTGCPGVVATCEESLNYRSAMRLVLEMLFCLIIPATISGFFYLSGAVEKAK